MRVASRLFIGTATFFAILFVVYWFTSHDPVGSTLLAIAVPACLLVGAYLLSLDRKVGELPEDHDGQHTDAVGDVVPVPATSLWPLGAAFGAGTLAAGLVFGAWLATAGAFILLASTIALALQGRDYS